MASPEAKQTVSGDAPCIDLSAAEARQAAVALVDFGQFAFIDPLSAPLHARRRPLPLLLRELVPAVPGLLSAPRAAYEKMRAKCAGNAKKSDGGGDGGDGGRDGDRSGAPSLLPTATETFLIGFDRTRADYERYAAQMPFPAIAWDDEAGAREQLAAAASLRGIPTLLLVRGSDGRILQSDGKTRVLRDPGLEGWPWAGIKPATNLLPLWLQWVLLGVFYLVMKSVAKNFRGWMG